MISAQQGQLHPQGLGCRKLALSGSVLYLQPQRNSNLEAGTEDRSACSRPAWRGERCSAVRTAGGPAKAEAAAALTSGSILLTRSPVCSSR
jgi:hypothetical protein